MKLRIAALAHVACWPIALSRPLSLSLVGAARRAPRRTTPAVVADARHGLERRRRWRAAGWGGAASYGVGEIMAGCCCARRDRAQSSSLFIPCWSRAQSAAPNDTRGRRRCAPWIGAPAEVASGGLGRRRELWGRRNHGRVLLRTARSGSVVLSLYPLLEPRAERRAERHPRSSPMRAMDWSAGGGGERRVGAAPRAMG